MKRQTLFVIGLLVSVLLLNISCAPGGSTVPIPATEHPAGWTNPRELTDAEKAKVIAAALDTPEIRARLKEEPVYKTSSLSWIAIVWNGSQASEIRILDYDWKKDPNFALVTKSSIFYALELFNFGAPPNWQVYIAVNPDNGMAFMVMENPFRTGPTPPSTSQ